jgi:hypothetical protein
MPRLFLLSALLLVPFPALATEKWEICLDKADFTFNLDGFLGSTTILKSQCIMRFAVSGGKGQKYEVDLCDPLVHIKKYPAIDSNDPVRLAAGSAGCPRPLFGADFDENSMDLEDYRDTRKRVMELWDSVKKFYGEGSDQVDLTNPKSFSPEVSTGKIACGSFLLKEYLQRCTSFESKRTATTTATGAASAPPAPAPSLSTPGGVPKAAPAPIPGIHPQTILPPKNKK